MVCQNQVELLVQTWPTWPYFIAFPLFDFSTYKHIIMIDFLQNLQTEEHNFQENFENAKHESTFGIDIPGSKDISGIEIRLSKVKVIDNKRPKVFPFPGFAKVYFVNLVVSDVSGNPVTIDLKGFEK